MTAVLRTENLSKSFGALPAADGIDFEIGPGARHALIGPNGAGKTTFVNLVTGRLTPTRGRVSIGGRDVTHLDQAARARLGLGRTFQINQLFPDLTVFESVAMAVAERKGRGWRWLRPFGADLEIMRDAASIVERFDLGTAADSAIRTLNYGRQRIVEIALAFALEPSLLLLDEPMAGVPAADAAVLVGILENLPGTVSVLIVEHDMDVVFRFARAITVLHQGRVVASGAPARISADPLVKEIYFGDRGAGHG
jgi:branched-chain amino acid transport system ATP-binding protein